LFGCAAVNQTEEAKNTPHTPEEWVETLVDQMSQAKTLDEARQRAAQVLQAFERAVLNSVQVLLILPAEDPAVYLPA
jgi:hypothetical protein